MPGVIPRPVAKNLATLSPDATDLGGATVETRVRREKVFEPDSAIFTGRDPYPRSFASLGETGTFRDQRYVEVRIAPVRFDPTLHGLRVARTLTVTIAFDGDTGARSVSAPDPRIEDLYRDMFANYGQGTTFRLQPASQSVSALASPLVGPRYRLRLRANGIVRLDLSRLTGTGFDSQPLSTYKLMNRGVEVPLLVFDANTNDQLNAGDWVQFYGQALDDEPKTVINTVIPGGNNIYELRDYSDENVYFLTTEPGARSRLATRNAPPNLTTPATTFDAVAHLETDSAFLPLGAADPWYFPTMLGNDTGGGGVLSLTQSVALPGLSAGTDPAHVVVRLRGRTEDPLTSPDHKSRITLLNSSAVTLTQNNDDGTFDGRTIYTHDFSWTYPGSGPQLTNPAQVKIEALSVPASSVRNEFFLDFVEIGYKRNFQASGDVLTFDYPDGDAEFLVTGLATNLPEVWELTGRVGSSGVVAPVRVTGATIGGSPGNFSARFHMSQDPAIPDGTPRRFVVSSTNGATIPPSADFTADTVSDLRSTSNQADLIVIAHPTALGPTATTTLSSLLAWKLANQGITSKIAMIQDVYDEFGDGLESPQAIKSFLAFTLSTNPGEGWSGRKPAWVLLIGDGTYDPKNNNTFFPPSNFVPTQILFKDDPSFGFYASDSILANVAGGDSIADLVVGRISTRTDVQTETVLHKTLDYEQNPPLGNWRRHAVFVSDRGKNYNALEATLQWEATNTAARNWLKLPPNTERTMRYWSDPEYCGGTANGCTPAVREALRADIKLAVRGLDGISDGASIMQYTGHGNFTVWSDDFFFAHGWNGFFDVNALDNGVKLPWLIVHNCLTGGFQDANDITQGEAWLKKAGGGALAVFSTSGLNDSYSGIEITNKLWGTLFGPTKDRVLGNAVASAMNFICGQGAQQTCQQYVLLGDPTTRLVFPTVQPPTDLVATAGNSLVDLNWTASPQGGVTYDIYRATTSPSFGYTPVGSSATTSFTDTSADNAKTYFYYVVAVDAEQFESRWSNFNSDCGVSGPDCVTATPMNPNPPPPPTGLAVTDPETGGKLVLTWNANAATDEIDHYTVWWGTASGDYDFSVGVGKQTTYSLSGLVDGTTTYYVAVTATNTSSHTSGYSVEQSGVPHFVRGVRSPQFVASLKVAKSMSGNDAVLTWTPVTVDIYNKATTIVSYEVFRGTTPIFVPGPGNKIGQPTTASFTDFGALAFANPNYHYLVRAVDANGNVGGAGNQLPDGIDALTISKTPDGLGGYTLGFSWPAVTTDFDNRPLVIDHYEVYAKSVPFSRADIKNNLVPLIASPSSASFGVTAPVASQYYSVIAVDAHGNKSPF
jgi:hypothetical protein